MPYQGLPGDEELNRAKHERKFRDGYGDNADAKSLYIAQPIWTRFAPLFPRIAFLLDSLFEIYNTIDTSLAAFRTAYVEHGGFGRGPDTLPFPRPPASDPFDFFNNYYNEDDERSFLLHLRWALYRSKGKEQEYLFRECAFDLLDCVRSEDRTMIVDELLSATTTDRLKELPFPVQLNVGVWVSRKTVVSRQKMLNDALSRVREALNSKAPKVRKKREEPPRPRVTYDSTDVEYGTGPLSNGAPLRTTRFAEDPESSGSSEASLSPPGSRRGRRHSHQRRSPSRESRLSSLAPSSVTTWAPEAPDHYTLSMKVWSASRNDWVEGMATMDTGCEGGSFISSAFLEEELAMGAEIVEDPEGEAMQFVDFGGKTDFKPRGKVRLRWYGRDIKHGRRRGKRSVESEDWFRVAPHLPSDTGSQPFQILLGKDWLHENEVLQYKGLRLFKTREKRSARKYTNPTAHQIWLTSPAPSAQEQAELLRRQRLRDEAEVERVTDRLASDAASISTGNSGTYGHSPNSSAQSVISGLPPSSKQPNGLGLAIDTHGIR